MRSLWLQKCKDLNYKLELLACHLEVFREKEVLKNFHENTYARVSFSLGLSSVISKVSVAHFEHEQPMLLFKSLKYLSQETNTYSNIATETLKQDVKSVKS